METTCFKCGKANCLFLKIEDCESLECKECGEEFTVADIEEHIKSMKKLVMVCKAAKKAAEAE